MSKPKMMTKKEIESYLEELLEDYESGNIHKRLRLMIYMLKKVLNHSDRSSYDY